jgi:hypothetical protein
LLARIDIGAKVFRIELVAHICVRRRTCCRALNSAYEEKLNAYRLALSHRRSPRSSPIRTFRPLRSVGSAIAATAASSRARLVIERFTRRGADNHIFHRVVKSLLRPERFAGIFNLHVFAVTGGAYVNDRGHPIQWTADPCTAEFASWYSLRVDHFVTKSRREFETKARRGRPDLAPGVQDRGEAFFTSRDLNEALDPMTPCPPILSTGPRTRWLGCATGSNASFLTIVRSRFSFVSK